MGRKLLQIALMALLIGAAVGCTHTTAAKDKPPDPLCCSKKPIVGKPRPDDPPESARLDPQPPPIPAGDAASIARQRGLLGTPRPLQVGFEGKELNEK